MSQSIFVRGNGKVFGPFTLEQLKELAQKNKLLPNHELSQDRQTWTPAAKIWGRLAVSPSTAGPSTHGTATATAAPPKGKAAPPLATSKTARPTIETQTAATVDVKSPATEFDDDDEQDEVERIVSEGAVNDAKQMFGIARSALIGAGITCLAFASTSVAAASYPIAGPEGQVLFMILPNFALTAVVVSIITQIFFLIWIYRARAAIETQGAYAFSFSFVTTAVCIFVPLLGLFFSHNVIVELSKASKGTPANWKSRSGPEEAAVWTILRVITVCLIVASFYAEVALVGEIISARRFVHHTPPETVQTQWLMARVIQSACAFSYVAALFLEIRLMSGVQAALGQKLAAAKKTAVE